MLKYTFLTFFLALNFIQLIQGRYKECTSSNSVADSKILHSLDGKLQGVCYDIPVRDHKKNVTNSDVFGWMSIPYAEAPVGENRFKNPKPVKSWNDVLDATKVAPSCMQKSRGNQVVSEDCLYLNIYVRADTYLNRENSNNLKPILFWIHGGGYTSGSGSSTDAYTLVALKDVVVVSINYRLGPLGFLNLKDTDATGNQGFLDQHVALQWAYDNADKFGGDKNRITISGTSAGAAFVNFHLFYKPSWPLFRSGIMHSSGVEGPNSVNLMMSVDEASSNADELMSVIDCYGSSNEEKLKCAQDVEASQIINSLSRDMTFNRLTFDNKVWTKTISELSEQSEFKKCNIITGFTSDEIHFPENLPTSSFSRILSDRLSGIVHSDLPEDYLSLIFQEYFNTTDLSTIDDFNYPLAGTRILSDAMFVCGSFKTAETFDSRSYGQNSWSYEFKYKNSESQLPDYYYASHGAESRYVFAGPLGLKSPNFPLNVEDAVFTEDFLTYLGKFLHNNDPNFLFDPKKSPAFWRKFNSNTDEILELKNGAIRMKNGYEKHHCDFWNNVIE